MVAVLLLLVTFALIAWLLWACDIFNGDAVKLNLRLVDPVGLCDYWYIFLADGHMAKLGDTLNATISPANAAGASAPVFGAVYDASGGYEVTTATDGLSAVVVAVASGTGFTLTCTATSKHGVVLTQTVPLPDVDVAVDDEAVTLNLAVA